MLDFVLGLLMYILVSLIGTWAFLGMLHGEMILPKGRFASPYPLAGGEKPFVIREGVAARLLGVGIFLLSIFWGSIFFTGVTRPYLIGTFGQGGDLLIVVPLILGIAGGIAFRRRHHYYFKIIYPKKFGKESKLQ